MAAREKSLMNFMRWWSAFLASLFLPWVAIFACYAFFKTVFPGEIRTATWEWFTSLAFLLGVIASVTLLLKTGYRLFLRICLACLIAIPGLWFACAFHFHSNCGDYSLYIGNKPENTVVSCS
jgi:hypothetical protein